MSQEKHSRCTSLGTGIKAQKGEENGIWCLGLLVHAPPVCGEDLNEKAWVVRVTWEH